MALCWRPIIAILVPLVLALVFFINNSTEMKWVYVVAIMTIFWVTEAVPQAVTSLLPIGLFPLLGLMVKYCFVKPKQLFIGIQSKFKALERILKLIANGLTWFWLNMADTPFIKKRLHFVTMAITMFISMWMQNFTVVVMMSTVCLAILEQLEIQGSTALFETKATDNETQPTNRVTMCYLLGITYAATLGGCGSLLVTPTSLAFKGIFSTCFPCGPEIDFLRFFFYGAPIMLLNTLLTSLWMQFYFMGLFRLKSKDSTALRVTDEDAKAAQESIIRSYTEMGRISTAEIRVAILILVFHCALAIRSSSFLTESKVNDASLTIIFVVVLFIALSKCKKASGEQESSQLLLTWSYVRRRIPWGLVFVIGAGISLAHCGRESKIHKTLANYLNYLKDLNYKHLCILFVVCVICRISTEFLSNAATANIILPFLAQLCIVVEIHPILLMFPATFSINMSFQSSIGTPGNAYVADLINIRKRDLFYCGIGPSIITLLTCLSSFPSYGAIFYEDLFKFPEWAEWAPNATKCHEKK